MLRSLFSGITGLRAHQTMMDVVGNNISNVNTTGFKSSTTVFEDTLSQMVRAAAAPGQGLGGLNPAQIGLGVQLGGISTNFGQGSAQTTNKTSDLMIQGDGFFIMKKGNEEVYTRAGNFNFDTDGRLTNNQGFTVQGYPAVNGVPDINAPLRRHRAADRHHAGAGPQRAGGDQRQHRRGHHGRDHPQRHVVRRPRRRARADDHADAQRRRRVRRGRHRLGGRLARRPPGRSPSTRPASRRSRRHVIDFADGTQVTIDLTDTTNFGGPASFDVKSADGYASGSLEQYKISPDGSIVGVFSNGQKLTMAQIGLANFNNPGGLEKIGNTSFRATTNSGLPQRGVAAAGGRGSLISGTLEMSNVDLAAEFTNLIIAQRGFQANSRVITSSDEMLTDLVNIKR